MANKIDKVEDPNSAKFWRLFLISAIVLVVVGIIVLVIGRVVAGGIITLLGAVFGLGAKVAMGAADTIE